MKFSPQEKKALVQQVSSWFHRIDLGDGIITPGSIPPGTHKTISSFLPKNLDNKTVLDIGSSNGYYSFKCEKRGATVTAIDVHDNAGFNTVKKILNSNVDFQKMNLFDLPKKKYDVVLFFGVLYHLKYPLKTLEIIYARTKELLVLESHYIKTITRKPMMRFYPGRELNNDSSNWWGPNTQCIVDMLKVVGFEKIEVCKKYHHIQIKNAGRVIIKAYK